MIRGKREVSGGDTEARGTTGGVTLVGTEEGGRGGKAAARRESDELSRELRVEAHRLQAWRDEFLAGGIEGLKARPLPPEGPPA